MKNFLRKFLRDERGLTAVEYAIAGGLVVEMAALDEDSPHDVHAEASHALHSLLPATAAVRAAVDALEDVVADNLWPLPTYQEMLFIL